MSSEKAAIISREKKTRQFNITKDALVLITSLMTKEITLAVKKIAKVP